MTIRSRLLLLLLPTIIALLFATSFLLYFNWYDEIVASFQGRLKSVALSVAATFPHEEELRPFSAALTKLSIDRIYLLPKSASFLQLSEEELSDLQSGPVATGIYLPKGGSEEIMSGYAPLIGPNGTVQGYVGVDANVSALDEPLHEAMLITLFCAAGMALILSAALFFISKKISKPVEKLKDCALAIAAGHYETETQVDGPKEIVELASTLGTMSACLQEQISRLQENALVREKLFGEHECALLMQSKMLQLPYNPFYKFSNVSQYCDRIQGLLLDAQETAQSIFWTLAESMERGFTPLYELIQSRDRSQFPKVTVELDKESLQLSYTCLGLPPPFVWSHEQNTRLQGTKIPLHSKDIILLYNHGLLKQFESDHELHAWFGRVLRHFSLDGLESVTPILEKELQFKTNLHYPDEDLHILCLQLT